MGSKSSKRKQNKGQEVTLEALTAIIEKQTKTLEGRINDLETKYETKIEEVKSLNEKMSIKQN